MQSASAPYKQLDDILQCPICTEVYTDPRALPCLHTYCYKCISDWCADKKPGDTPACPMCRKEFTIPGSGVSSLPKNFFIANLLSMNNLKITEVKQKLCDVCEDTDDDEGKSTDRVAKVFCLDCQQTLCKPCSGLHGKMKNSSLHKQVDLDEMSTDVDVYSKYLSSFCDKHLNEQIKLYCFNCKTTMCMMCYVKDHSKHDCSELVEVASNFKVGLQQDIKNLMAAIKTVEENLVIVDSRKVSFLDQVARVETMICEKVEELKKLIDEEKQNLLKTLHEIKSNYEKETANMTEEIMQDMSMLVSFKKYCNELMLKGTTVDITRESESLHKHTEELTKIKGDEEFLSSLSRVAVKFLPSRVVFNESNSIIGHIVREGIKPGTPTLGLSLPGNSAVGALAILRDELFITRHGQPSVLVYVYDTVSLKLTRELSVPGLGWYTYGLAVCGVNNYVYVSDYYNNCVRKVDLSPAEITPVTKFTVSDNPAGLSVNGNHNILVAYYRLKKVQEYDSVGTLIREFSDNNYLWQAVESGVDAVLVSRHGPIHGVFTIAKDIWFNRCLGDKPGSGSSEFNNPGCLAIDSSGNVFVADQNNNRIQVLNSSLTAARTLPLPVETGLQFPFALCLDESRGRLYVGECGGQKRVLMFDGVTCMEALFNSS